jgi:hypothetical protein
MRFFVRLVISLAGGLTALAMLLVFLTFLVSEHSAPAPQGGLDSADVLTSTIEGRSAARTDFEVVGDGVIVPVSTAPELLNQCSRETVSPVASYWRPTPSMIRDLETRLPTFLAYESRLQPLARYVRQYAGVVSEGRTLIYASFATLPADIPWQNQVVVVCDGGNRAWGVAYDVDSQAFDTVRINGAK